MKQTLFRSFSTREECLAFGGTAYAEFQYCRMPVGTAASELVFYENIVNWAEDSLYVHLGEWEAFWAEYGLILDGSLREDLTTGPLELWSINYYPPTRVREILAVLRERKPVDYEILSAWMEKACTCNGIYILGI